MGTHSLPRAWVLQGDLGMHVEMYGGSTATNPGPKSGTVGPRDPKKAIGVDAGEELKFLSMATAQGTERPAWP